MRQSRTERRSTARHEAAHAVVATRLGLPVASVVIGGGGADPYGLPGASTGHTALDPARWPVYHLGQQLTDQDRRNITNQAVNVAAGVVAETRAGEGELSDLAGLLELAAHLGVIPADAAGAKVSTSDPGFAPWYEDCVARASAILDQDGGAAWDRVRVALERKGRLSGEEVASLIEQSDRTQGSG